MDSMEKNNSDTCHHDEVTGRKRKAETVVDKLSDEHIYSPCPPAVKGKGAFQISPIIKKTKTSLKKKTRTSSPVCDLDMDVDNSDHEQYNTSCNQNTGKIGPKKYTTVKDAKKRSKKNTKTGSPLGNGGDDYAELEEKQYRQSSCSKVDNRGGQVDSTAAVTTKRKSAVGSLPAASHDMDVDIPGRVEKRTYGNPEADKIGPKHSKNVKKIKKPLERHTKTYSPLCDDESDDDGNDEQEQDKKTRTTGRPVKKCETTTSKQNTKNVKKLPSQSNRARKGEKVLAKQQHVETPSSHKKKGATVSVEEVMRHDQRHDDDTKNTAASSQPVQSDTDDENENDKYVYRVLRIGESYEEGIYPKNLNSKVKLEEHVLRGSSSIESRFVSCCKTIDGVHNMAIYTNFENCKRDVVEINISKLPKGVTVIDLTDNYTRDQHLQNPSALRYAQMYEEVILEPKMCTCIPSECIEKIGEIRHKEFNFTN